MSVELYRNMPVLSDELIAGLRAGDAASVEVNTSLYRGGRPSMLSHAEYLGGKQNVNAILTALSISRADGNPAPLQKALRDSTAGRATEISTAGSGTTSATVGLMVAAAIPTGPSLDIGR